MIWNTILFEITILLQPTDNTLNAEFCERKSVNSEIELGILVPKQFDKLKIKALQTDQPVTTIHFLI